MYSAVDAIDRDIIHHLEANGRITNAELAARIGLSPTPTLRRVKNLEREGIIAGYRAVIDPDAIGRNFRAMVWVDLVQSTRNAIVAFETTVRAIDEVTECNRLFGEPDYLLNVTVADADAYERLYTSTLATLPGIRRAVSQIIMKRVKP